MQHNRMSTYPSFQRARGHLIIMMMIMVGVFDSIDYFVYLLFIVSFIDCTCCSRLTQGVGDTRAKET
jgi:hypothetical protein